MTRDRQLEPVRASHPAAVRWLALVCILLFGWVSSAQAAHIHGKLLPKTSATVQAPSSDANGLGGEEHCPLCVVAQASLPISLELLPIPVTPMVTVQPCDLVLDAGTVWHPCSLSRPPPTAA